MRYPPPLTLPPSATHFLSLLAPLPLTLPPPDTHFLSLLAPLPLYFYPYGFISIYLHTIVIIQINWVTYCLHYHIIEIDRSISLRYYR